MSYGKDAHSRRRKEAPAEFFTLENDLSEVERIYISELLDLEADLDSFDFKTRERQKEKNRRFRECGKLASRKLCPSCTIKFYTRFFCKHRLCDRCSRVYGREIREKILELVRPCFANKRPGWTVAMLTLSESSDKYRGRYPNAEEYKRFNRNVAALCRLFYGKYAGRWSRAGKVVENRKRFRGAGTIAVNEFGQDNTNLHCHVLLYGPFVPYEKLLNAWIRITGGDRGCHIEPVRDPDQAARYTAKYITKPARFLDPKTAVEFVKATKSQRRIRTGGIFYNQIKIEKVELSNLCPFCAVDLEHSGLCNVLESLDGLNLSHVRRHRELYETEALKRAVKMLPGGALPYPLPKYPQLMSF